MYKKIGVIILIVTILFLFSSCIPGDGTYSSDNPAGFFSGVWHGWIAPLSLIMGLFNSNIKLYETFNTGWWYSFGFYIAIISGFGGISLTRKKYKKNKD